MKQKLSFSAYFFVGSMLFGLFFGAGNLIFPVHLGQESGSQVLPAAIGFILTSTGLPFLGTLAIGISDSGSLLGLASQVSRKWGYFFTLLLYMTIGPLFALPRTATVSYEVGFSLYMPESWVRPGLFVFTLLFFGAALFFSLFPGKLLLWIGKILNPLFLVLLGILIIASFVKPMGNITQSIVHAPYLANPFFKGFTEGYNTMDALASLAFGILVVNALKDLGVSQPKDITKNMAKAGIVSALLMAIIYSCLAYMGSSSMGQLNLSENGGIALAQIAQYYFGNFGTILLAIIVTVACLKTAIGLITACADVFVELFPNSLSYRTYVVIFTVMSGLVANVGLTQIIKLSLPILMFIYPLAMVLIILSLIAHTFHKAQIVYITTIVTTTVFSIGDGLAALPDQIRALALIRWLLSLYEQMPFFHLGMAWGIPAIVGFMVGMVLYWVNAE